MTHPHHHDKVEKSDIWTRIGALVEFLASLVGSTASFVEILELLRHVINGENEDEDDLSITSLSIAIAISLYSVLGSTYCHYILNTINQKNKSETQTPAPEEVKNLVDDKPTYNTFSNTPDLEQGHTDENNAPIVSLNIMEILALLADAISHLSEGIVPFILGFDVLKSKLPTTLSTKLTIWAKLGVLGVTTVLGGLGAVADVRTCYKSILKYKQDLVNALFNQTHQATTEMSDNDPVEKPDFWTLFSTLVEFAGGLFGTTISFSQLADLFSTVNDNSDDELSTESLIFAGIIALYFVTSSTYCHQILNTNYQKTVKENEIQSTSVNKPTINVKQGNGINTDASDVENKIKVPKAKLSKLQRFFVWGDWGFHTSDYATSLILGIENFTRGNLPIWGKASLIGAATFFSAAGAYTEKRTCENNVIERNQDFIDATYKLKAGG